jgi:transcriptional regulator with XRE-family HTH domain
MRLNEQVGRRLRELREQRRLSLSELARRSKLGKATLSELETGQRNPTLETLYAVTTALGVPLSSVLTDPAASAAPGASAGPATAPATDGDAVTAALIERYEAADAVTEVFRVRIRPGVVQRSAPHLPGTVEHLYVIAGTARVGDPAAPLTAGPGEDARWAADAPHVYEAPDGLVEGVLLIRYRPPA